MNEKITAYLNEVYGKETEDVVNLSQLVEAFEEKYETKVGDILISEDSMYIHYDRDDSLILSCKKVVFDVIVFFCENYIAYISIQPEQTKLSYFQKYSSIETVRFNDLDSYMTIGDYKLEKVKGHPHWAMDAIRAHILPRFK